MPEQAFFFLARCLFDETGLYQGCNQTLHGITRACPMLNRPACCQLLVKHQHTEQAPITAHGLKQRVTAGIGLDAPARAALT